MDKDLSVLIMKELSSGGIILRNFGFKTLNINGFGRIETSKDFYKDQTTTFSCLIVTCRDTNHSIRKLEIVFWKTVLPFLHRIPSNKFLGWRLCFWNIHVQIVRYFFTFWKTLGLIKVIGCWRNSTPKSKRFLTLNRFFGFTKSSTNQCLDGILINFW